MCSYGEEPEVFDAYTRKALKQHACSECARKIQSGETYEYASGKWEGVWRTYKTCAQCFEAKRWLDAICSGYVFGQVLDDLWTHIHEGGGYYSFGLRRLYVGMRMKWMHRGELTAPSIVSGWAQAGIDAVPTHNRGWY